MKLAIVKCINGNFFIHAEGITSIASAKTNFHSLCATLWNEPDVITAEVAIVDEQLNCVEGIKEFITHPAQVEEPVEDGE